MLLIVDARDGSGAPHPHDAALLARLPADAPRLVVHNKSDLAGVAPRAEARTDARHVWLSALTGDGVALLEDQVREAVGVDAGGEDTFLARERHLAALRDAAAHLGAAQQILAADAPALELFAEELRLAQDPLSSITGAFTADDLLGVIFSALLHRQIAPFRGRSRVYTVLRAEVRPWPLHCMRRRCAPPSSWRASRRRPQHRS